uniref:Uncharacterized protein n=1 Tax=Anguilla anguilla TaxID=7936 RepID=A0A0E9T0L6_ANGAN
MTPTDSKCIRNIGKSVLSCSLCL